MNTPESEPLKIQVLQLRGELDLHDMEQVAAKARECLRIGNGHVFVVLELGNVTHMHLAGLPLLVDVARRLREYGGDLKLAGCSAYLTQILRLAGYGREFDQTATLEQAAARFQAQGRRWAHNGDKHDSRA